MKVGDVFGRLTVLRLIPDRKNPKAECRCECGAIVAPQRGSMRNGRAKSCGCMARELIAEVGHSNRTHGQSGTRTYACWSDAKKRCHSPTNKRFPQYGARGIAMCDRWRESFENFLHDMGECPPGLTLERQDNDKGYEPGNCIWANREQQAQNRKWNKTDADGVKQIRARAAAGEPRQHIADAFGMSISNVEQIIARKTWRNVP